ncbi:hypothetical protein PAMP_004417 [Pampus punctatissimus]
MKDLNDARRLSGFLAASATQKNPNMQTRCGPTGLVRPFRQTVKLVTASSTSLKVANDEASGQTAFCKNHVFCSTEDGGKHTQTPLNDSRLSRDNNRIASSQYGERTELGEKVRSEVI